MNKICFVRVASIFVLGGCSLVVAMDQSNPFSVAHGGGFGQGASTGSFGVSFTQQRPPAQPAVAINLNDLPDDVKLRILKAGKRTYGCEFLSRMSQVSKAWHEVSWGPLIVAFGKWTQANEQRLLMVRRNQLHGLIVARVQRAAYEKALYEKKKWAMVKALCIGAGGLLVMRYIAKRSFKEAISVGIAALLGSGLYMMRSLR